MGANNSGQPGVYGTEGIPAVGNVPGGRYAAASWIDHSGNLWLFGGENLNSGQQIVLNDLWEFNPTNNEWTWISGSNAGNAQGVYGTQGTASTSNVPSSRTFSTSWTDSNGNLWLFGGDSLLTGSINDLWEFNPTTKAWTWVSGSSTAGTKGTYGTIGVASTSNVPGAREGAIGWTDSSGNLWLYGGGGNDSTGAYGGLNDVWEFSPTAKTWTWVSGANTVNAPGVYGTEGTAAASNAPEGRENSVNWIDTDGNLWIFGGEGLNPVGNAYNDLWRFQP